MTSAKIIERLLQKKWFINVNNDHELALVFNACIDANITRYNSEKINNYDLSKNEEMVGGTVEFIYLSSDDGGILWSDCYSNTGKEDITNWFFEEISKWKITN